MQLLVVGGGYVGLEKITALFKNNPNAQVYLVGTTVSSDIKALIKKYPNFRYKERSFKKKDLRNIEVALLATDSQKTNLRIRKLAKKKNILVNVADTPDLCDFYLGSTVKKGNLKVGISTNGKSPTFAKRFREVLEEVLPEDTDDLLQNLKKIRDSLKGDFGEKIKQLNKVTASLKQSDQDNRS